jgi:hypothetical protein
MSVRITALLALLVAALALGGGGGAGAASQSPAKIDFTSRAAVDGYLKSIGVNPATVVRQTGRLNYAGPRCPGSRWTCTTARRVVQISAAGGQNVFDCAGNPAGPGQSCLIMQNTGGRNTASCVEHSSTVSEQHCVIHQTGVRNFARVDQLVVEGGGSTQDATQTAEVTQSGATEQNELQADQDVQQDSGTGTPQTQDAHQYVLLNQGAMGKGNNFAHVHQSQDQNASGSAVTQNQNTTVPGAFSTLEAECNAAASTASHGLVITPNACAKFTQSSVNGDNEAHLHQFANESEKSTASATQRQGLGGNGLGGGFEQTVAPLGTGSSHNHTTQHKQQQASSNGGSKTQVDPIGCCGASQVGGVHDLENIDQMSTQTASGGPFQQNADLVGTSDSLSGTCSVSHHVRENEASTNVNESDNTPPCALDVTTSCTSFNVEGTFGNCTTTSCPCGGLVTAPSPLVTVLASIPTLGQPLPALDVTTEPSSYVLPSWYVPF